MSDTPSSYTPRGDRVVVQRLDRPAPPPGVMILPDSQQKLFDEGIVRYVGPGLRSRFTGDLVPIDGISPGDHVCFLEMAGTEIDIDGEKLLSLRDEEIHGVRKVPSPEPFDIVFMGSTYKSGPEPYPGAKDLDGKILRAGEYVKTPPAVTYEPYPYPAVDEREGS